MLNLWKEPLKKKTTKHTKKQTNKKPDADKSFWLGKLFHWKQANKTQVPNLFLSKTYSFFSLYRKKWSPFPSEDSKVIVATELDFMTWTTECKCEFSSGLPSLWRKQVRNSHVLFPFCFLCTNWKLQKTQNI